MKVSYRWLQDYVECDDIPVPELADRLTMAGLEVEGVEERRFRFSEQIVAGEILEVRKHPEASGLFVCQVDVGKDDPLPIVCGAPNTVPHIKSPVALPGSELPNGMAVRTASIRGVTSHGVICAEDELGISEDHSGIMILAPDIPVGTPLSQKLAGVEDDAIFEIGLTPNRGDCLSHLGVAREIATLLARPLKTPAIDYPEEGKPIAEMAAITIEDPDLCPRYTASVITGVKIGPSPLWLRRRVESVGMRSINNVVDVTNFVMLELGQPLHAFDFDTLAEGQIIVRRAQNGERFSTLDEMERLLDDQTLMIADGQRSVAIGGVMGGLNSEISGHTTNILLESAYFSPSSIRKTSKKLGLSTEASYRFERNIDLLNTDTALRRATQLIVELGEGTAAQGILDKFPLDYRPLSVALRLARVTDILGVQIDSATVRHILTTLGFRLLETTDQGLTVEVPSYRPDVTREIDLIEEIGRIYSYDNIPTHFPSGEIPSRIENPARDMVDILRETLLSQGLHEVINYSFFDARSLEILDLAEKAPYNRHVPLKNPLTVEHGSLRTTTIPGLLANVVLNTSNRVENIRLFEIGTVFFQTEPSERLPEERTMISAIFSGARRDRSWAYVQTPLDFYDIKGILEVCLERVNVTYEFVTTTQYAFLHPGEAAEILIDGQSLGYVGKLHPTITANVDLDTEQVYLFELFLAPLVQHGSLRKTFRPIPKFPAVYRDLALVVPKNTIFASDIEKVIHNTGQPLLEHFMLFDRYVGPQIEEGYIGLTYSLQYRSGEKTLTDSEVSAVHERIIKTLQTDLGVQLR